MPGETLLALKGLKEPRAANRLGKNKALKCRIIFILLKGL
jgi:hypothetical protein